MIEAEYRADDTTGSDKDDLFRRLKLWYKDDIEHASKWRKEAREAFSLYSNDQWSKEDRNALKAKNRVPIEFNQIAPMVNAVVGSEINNRREVQYIPREVGDAKANEVLTAAGEWFRDQTGAEDEESDAFQDNVIAGMGWTDTRLEFEEDPDGAPKVEHMDPFEMVWDCNSVKPNLADATRMFRVREMPYSEAKELVPGVPVEELNATWAKIPGGDKEPHDQDRADLYDGSQSDYSGDGPSKKCTIVEARWLERETYYRGPDLQTGEVREYAEQQVKLLEQQVPGFRAVKQYRKVVRRAFLGKKILGKVDKPMAPAGQFGWECMTGYRDKITAMFYGIVRAAKDPQMWTNKLFSQVLYLLNSQSKGGIAAEKDAFDDIRQAEESWAKADEITWLKKGSLSGDRPKIMPKAPAQFPAGFFQLFQESKDEIHKVVGISPEFIGTREVDQAGVLEMQRRQSSLNLLAPLFNSLRRYRKRQGKIMLYLIQEHLSDGRLIRIIGDDRKQYVPLTKANVASSTYDIIVDDAPTSPNEKERTWQILMQMLPMVKDMMTPDIALELLRWSPLPASMVEKLQTKAAQQAQQPKPPTPEEMKVQAETQMHQMDMAGKQADLQTKQVENQMDVQMKGIELMIKQREAEMDQAIAQGKLRIDAQKLALQEQANAIARQNAGARQTQAAKQG